MNRKIYLIGMMALAMLFASCKKEEKPEVQEEFSIMAVTENDGSKTYLDGNLVKWIVDDQNPQNSDVIKVFDKTGNAVDFKCSSIIGDNPQAADYGTNANFTSTTAIDDQGEYWAFYPATQEVNPSHNGNTFSFTMPATQTYKDAASFANNLFPMAAHYPSGSKSGVKLQFKNACGILRIKATGNCIIKSIVLTDNNNTNNALSGNFTFNPDNINNNPTAAAGNNSNVLTLKITDGKQLDPNNPTYFYMILPPGCLAGAFNLKFYDVLNPDANTDPVKEIDKTQAIQNFAVERSTMKTATVDATKIPSFSVGGGVKVQFASGNLKSYNYGGNWGFQPNQWTHTGTQGEGGRGWFYYSNSNSDNNYGINYKGKGGSFVDWGNLFPGQGWRTLTKDEWHYVVFDRTNASNLRELTYVNGFYGLVLLPDGWNFSATYNSWAAKEAAGAVFLPRTSSCVHSGSDEAYPYYCGMINFIGGDWASSDAARNGYYWSSTLEGEDKCYYLYFEANGSKLEVVESGGQGYARAVRLVKNV